MTGHRSLAETYAKDVLSAVEARAVHIRHDPLPPRDNLRVLVSNSIICSGLRYDRMKSDGNSIPRGSSMAGFDHGGAILGPRFSGTPRETSTSSTDILMQVLNCLETKQWDECV